MTGLQSASSLKYALSSVVDHLGELIGRIPGMKGSVESVAEKATGGRLESLS